MNLLRYIFTVLLGIGFLGSFMPEAVAQVNPKVQIWNFGKVYLATGDTVEGQVAYYREEEIIKVDQDENSYTFAPVNVSGFSVKDPSQLTYQEFRTMLWHHNNQPNGYKRPVFFEVLEEGTYTLFKRDTYIWFDNKGLQMARMAMGVPMPGGGNYTLLEVFYILGPNGKLIQIKNARKELEPVFASKNEQVKAFMKENNLSFSKTNDMKTIFRYYNSLL